MYISFAILPSCCLIDPLASTWSFMVMSMVASIIAFWSTIFTYIFSCKNFTFTIALLVLCYHFFSLCVTVTSYIVSISNQHIEIVDHKDGGMRLTLRHESFGSFFVWTMKVSVGWQTLMLKIKKHKLGWKTRQVDFRMANSRLIPFAGEQFNIFSALYLVSAEKL